MSLAFDPLKQHMKIWVCWAPPNKQPLQPDGAPAKSNDPSTWHTFDECIASGMGLGCMITEPYVGVDLDDCRDTGTGIIAPWAVALIAAARSYTEISPSGTGVHIWHWRKPGPATKSVKKNGVEIYFESRYFTHTGNQVAGTPDSFSEYDPAVYSARLGSPGVLEVTAVQPIPDGMRNETLFKRGCGMRAQGQNYESIYSGLQDINKFCNPPKPDFEVQTIARSAMRYEPSTALAIFKQMSSNGENN